jgi:hypothetical protein
MMRVNRASVILIASSLLIPSLGRAGQPQEGTRGGVPEKTFTISGNAGGLGSVTLMGLPGEPTTRIDGSYSAQVPEGWTGTVTPLREGFAFQPPSISYTQVARDLSHQDYIARIITLRISGTAGLGGVRMMGLPGAPITDENGVYAAEVEYGWSGKVELDKEGYVFTPASRQYPRVIQPLPNQDYQAEVRMLTISEQIKVGNEPITEIKVTAEPGGQSVLTDLQGRYTIQVPYGWTGRLVFEKPGFVFAPDSKQFTNVASDIRDGRSAPSSGSPSAPPSRAPAHPRAILPGPAGSVVVIPTAQVAPQEFAETAEDMRVMLQILREKLSEPRMVRGVFVDFGDFFSDRDRALEAFYLQGSAVVFVLEMDSPFSLAPGQPEEGEAAKEAVDPVWQRARQKLYTPPGQALPGAPGLPGETRKMDFQQFQADLLQTLRHAANLRHVEPNEWIVVTIISHDESAAWPAPARAGGTYFGGAGGFSGGSYSTSGGSFGPGGGTSYADSYSYSRGSPAGRGGAGRTMSGAAPGTTTVLTIQAKKADIDAHAQGELSFEQFQQRVKTFTY